MSSQGNTTIKAAFQMSATADAEEPPQTGYIFQSPYLLNTAQYNYQGLYGRHFTVNGG